ncbi:hypothetical protein PanWU01x14_229520, partial [Parasponia andersonii]
FLATQPDAMLASSHIGFSSSSSASMAASIWVLDSCVSQLPNLSSIVSLSHKSFVSIVTTDGTPMPLAGIGPVVTPYFYLPNVYHIPNLTLNLYSINQLCDSGYIVVFSSIACYVQDPYSQKLIGIDCRQNGPHILD